MKFPIDNAKIMWYNIITKGESQRKGEKKMNKKEYADILKFAMQSQKHSVNDEIRERLHRGEDVDFLEGVVRGLEIAIEKIDASMFLTEKE